MAQMKLDAKALWVILDNTYDDYCRECNVTGGKEATTEAHVLWGKVEMLCTLLQAYFNEVPTGITRRELLI